MNIKTVIKTALRNENKTQTWLSEKLGYAGPTGIIALTSYGSMSLRTLLRICEALNYEITIQPKRKPGVRPKGQLVIREEEDDE